MNTHWLDTGIYSLAEASRLAEVTNAGLRWWFKDRPDREADPLLTLDYPVRSGEYTISFLSLIEMRMVSKLRSEGVSMPTIRRTYGALVARLQTTHPFAHTDIYTDGLQIFVHAARDLGADDLCEAVSRQHFFPKVRRFLTQIDYSDRTGLARRWNISKGVVIDPALRRGKPVVKGTGIATFVLANCFFANGERRSVAADIFDVHEHQVEDAVAFEERYGLPKAA